MERGEKIVVGVNGYTMEEKPFDILYIDETTAREQTARVASLKQRRDNARVAKSLADPQEAAAGTDANLMPFIVEASRAYATIGEMCDALREVFGEYEESPTF
jgi:methylmalonyl-CoA mutase N-terminal domain/subunit